MKISKILFGFIFVIASTLGMNAHASWNQSSVISGSDCTSLGYDDVTSFLVTYYFPTLGYDPSHKKAGKKMMESYAIASALMTRSQICMAEALELKELTDSLKKQQAILAGGSSLSEKEINKHRKNAAAADKEIRAAAEAKAELTPEQRTTFGLGAGTYLAATYATYKLFNSIEDYTKATKDKAKNKGLGGMLGGGGTAVTVALISKGVLGLLKDAVTTGGFLVDYSKEKKIGLPDDATNKLKEIAW